MESKKKMNYKNLFHGNLQDASTITAEAIIFLHDYVMFFLIIIIVVILVLLVKVKNNYSYSSLLLNKEEKNFIKKVFFLIKFFSFKLRKWNSNKE